MMSFHVQMMRSAPKIELILTVVPQFPPSRIDIASKNIDPDALMFAVRYPHGESKA